MSGNVDILTRLSDVADIGRIQLQTYCDDWLRRPVARHFGVSHLIVGSDLKLTLNLDVNRVEFANNKTYVPIFELLDYVIEQHFADSAKRRELHGKSRDLRQRWGEVGIQYEAMAGRVGVLWIKCKNPNCDASLETAQQAVEGQRVHCAASEVTCPVCRQTYIYDGDDLKLRLES